jgi:hypothetical protein
LVKEKEMRELGAGRGELESEPHTGSLPTTGGPPDVPVPAADPAHQVIKYGVKTERSGCLLLFVIKNTNNSQRNRVKTVKKRNSHRIFKTVKLKSWKKCAQIWI